MTPSVSVVIGTRNKGESVATTCATILANDYPCFDVTVVDQSADDRTQIALGPYLRDPRVHYIRTLSTGLARGQNIGVAASRGDLIAITDDDCRAPASWIRNIVSAFEMDSRIGLVLGIVLADKYDHHAGFTQSYTRAEPFLARHVGVKHRVEGIGANMAWRRNVWQELNGLDEMLGAGTPLYAAEETDFIIRTLLAGYYVYETPRLSMIHDGFRTWEAGQPLIQGYMCGLAAMYVKFFKCGRWSAVLPFFHQVWRWAFDKPSVDFGQIPSRWLRMRGFANGLWKGMRTPVDREKCLYRNR